MPYPLQVILSILGLPESDYQRMMTLTQELFGATDPDLQRGQGTPEEIGAVIMEFYMYFAQLTQERMADPTDDLASLIANGRDQGRADARPREARLLHHHRHRRPRHHVGIDVRGHGATRPASRATRAAAFRSVADRQRGRRDDPARLARASLHANGDRRHRDRRPADREGRLADAALHGGESRPEALRRTRSSSMSRGRTPTSRSPSGSGSTSASVPSWPARSSARCSPTSCLGSPRAELAGGEATSKAVFVSGYKSLPLRYTLDLDTRTSDRLDTGDFPKLSRSSRLRDESHQFRESSGKSQVFVKVESFGADALS